MSNLKPGLIPLEIGQSMSSNFWNREKLVKFSKMDIINDVISDKRMYVHVVFKLVISVI
jgi:hypothetical protein